MSFFGWLFGSRKEQIPDKHVNSVVKRFAEILNNNDVQNSITASVVRPEIYRRMQRGGSIDKLPNAYGEFGKCLTNPIPVNGTLGELTYLSRLLTKSGKKIFFHRLGSINTIDIYEIVSVDGSVWDILFLDFYHMGKSRRTPSGYKFQEYTVSIRGTNMYAENFPYAFDGVVFDTIERIFQLPIGDVDSGKISNLKRPPQHLAKVKECLAHIHGQSFRRDGRNIIRAKD